MKKFFLTTVFIFSAVLFSCSSNNEENNSKNVSSLKFEKDSLSINVEQQAVCVLNINPKNADIDENELKFSLIPDDVCEVIKQDESGCIIKGLKKGSAVITASYESLKSYISVDVEDTEASSFPYIKLLETDVQIERGKKRTVTANLVGCRAADINKFKWQSSDPSIIEVEYSGSTAVLTAKKYGGCTVTVSNECCMYSTQMIAVVPEKDGKVFYLTTKSNVIDLTENESRDFEIEIVGGNENDYSSVKYRIKEGSEYFSISGSGNKCSINAKKTGEGQIEIMHPDSAVSLLVTVNVNAGKENDRIICDSDFIYFDSKSSKSIQCSLLSGRKGSFTYSVDKEGIIDVVDMNGQYLISPVSNGTVTMKISSSLLNETKEVKIAVDNIFVTKEFFSIKTNQNVIKLSEGDENAELEMELIGGNEADRSGFVWNIKDPDIINVETSDGRVNYERSISEGSFIKSRAFIKALKKGHSVIEVSHPKSSNICSIDVFVYEKGILSDSLTDVKGELLVKGEIGKTYEYVLEGNNIDYGKIKAEISDGTVAEIKIENGRITYNTLKKGNVVVTLSSSQFKNKWSFNLVCDTKENLEKQKYIKSDVSCIKGIKDKEIYFSVNGEFSDTDYNIEAVTSDDSVCSTSVISNMICVKLLNEGNALVRITCSGFDNNLYIPVYCVKSDINLDKPYMFEGDSFITLSLEKEYEYEYVIEGADEKEYFSTDCDYDSQMIFPSIQKNTIKIKALKEGKGVITLKNPGCIEDKKINYIIYKTQQEAESKNILWCSKEKIQGKKGEKFLLTVNETKKTDEALSVSSDNINKVEIVTEGNLVLIELKEEGSCILKIEKTGSEKLYVEINILPGNYVKNENYIKMPYLIQGIVNQKTDLIYEASDEYKNLWENIQWDVPQCFSIFRIKNGIRFISSQKGEYEIKGSYEPSGISQKIKVIIYENEEEILKDIRIYLEKDSYSIKEGEELDLCLDLKGNAGDEFINSIKWEETDGADGVQINGHGKNCSIKGIKEGLYSIKAAVEEKNICFNFSVQVNKEKSENYRNFIFERVVYVEPEKLKTFSFSTEEKTGLEVQVSGIKVTCNDMNIDLSCNGNNIAVRAREEGEYYCTLSGYGMNDYVFIVRCQNVINEEDYIFCNIKTMEIGINETKQIEVYSSAQNISQIQISASSNSIEIKKTENGITVMGLREDSGYIKFNFNEKEYTIYYTVNRNKIEEETLISVPEIIYLQKESMQNIYVLCSRTVFYEWDKSRLEINENGNNFSVKAILTGLTEIKVFTDENNYRMIKVFVYEDETEILDKKFINITKRVYKGYKGQTVTVNPLINGNDYQNISSETEGNNIEVKKENGNYKIEIKEEGFSKVIFKYHEDNVCIFVYGYEKENDTKNTKHTDDMQYYITSDEMYSFIKIDDVNTFKVSVKDFEGNYVNVNDSFIWKCSNPEIAELNQSYNICTVRAKKKGRALIYCSNLRCSNILCFTIDTGTSQDLFESRYSFIYTQKTVIDVDINESTDFEAEFKNIKEENRNSVSIKYKEGNICSAVYTVNDGKIYFNVKGIKCGKETFSIKCDGCDFQTDITVIVNPKTGGKTPYISTSQNYNVIRPGETALLSVRMENYEEYDMASYRWEKTGGDDCITVIGNGSDIQIYGKKEGSCTLRVRHIPTSSEMNLYVTVSSQVKSVKYMTTKTLVVDTKVSSALDSIMMSVVGGEDKDNSGFIYKADREDVISITGSGENLYYRGLKEGTAKVHVSNPVSGCVNELDIIFIVTDTENEAVMKAETNSLYLKKNTASKNVNISFENCENINEGVIEWFIYSQVSKYEKVVSIVSSGKRCVIKPENEGYATIRAYYPPLNISTSISVYVDESGKAEFEKSSIKIAKNESGFIGVKIPEYIEEIAQYITYESMDESVCKVFGTGKVCCIEALEKGSCIIRAVNSLDGSVSEAGVTVCDEEKSSAVLTLRKNTFLLNPRAEDQKLSAGIRGNGIEEYENENITWQILSDTTGCLSLYPQKGSDVLLKMNPVSDLQSTDYGKVREGQAVIQVSHSLCEVPKTIYVSIDELDNYFTLEKYSVKMNVSQSVTIDCNILNSKVSDYDKVSWTVSGYDIDKYGNKVDVCRLLTDKGKSCSIFGLNEGTCTVTAFYLGSAVSCEVNVTADRIFKVNGTTTVKMFPDMTEENYVDISYILRPSSQVPLWSVQNIDRPSDVNLINIEEIPGSQKIRLRPNGMEGKVKIIGFVVGVGQVTINAEIKFMPELRFKEEVTDCVIQMNDSGENIRRIKFESYPSMYYVKLTKSGKYADYADIFIEDTKKKGDYTEGTVVVKAKKEFPLNGISVLLEQYRSANFEESSKVNNTDSRLSFNVSAYYPDSGFSLGFRRGRGGFSFFNESVNAAYLYNVSDRFIDEGNGNTYYKFYESDNANPKPVEMGDGEQHYFVMKTKHENQFMEDLSVTIESENRRLKVNDILNNKMKDLSEDDRQIIMDNIESFSGKSMPAVSAVEKRADGSYVFDISTGALDYKYGVNWYVKGAEQKSKKLSKADRFYCSRTQYHVPVFEGLGTLDDVTCITTTDGDTTYFKFPGSNNKYILNYNQIIKNQNNLLKLIQQPNYELGLSSYSSYYEGPGPNTPVYNSNYSIGLWNYYVQNFGHIPTYIINDYLNRNSLKVHVETQNNLSIYYISRYQEAKDKHSPNDLVWKTDYKLYADLNLRVMTFIIEGVRYALFEYNVGAAKIPDKDVEAVIRPGTYYIMMRMQNGYQENIAFNEEYWDETEKYYLGSNGPHGGVNTIGMAQRFWPEINGHFFITKHNKGVGDFHFEGYERKNFIYGKDDEFTETVRDYSIHRNFDFSSAENIEYCFFTDDNIVNQYTVEYLTNYVNYYSTNLHVYPSPVMRMEEINSLRQRYKNLYDYESQLQKYCDKAYYNNDTVSDFEYNGIYIVVRWKGITGMVNERRIPLNVLFYNNYSDYYTFENGYVKTNPDRINENITQIDFN